jgi:hypothetical protein
MRLLSRKAIVAATMLSLSFVAHADALEKCAGSARGSAEYREAAEAVFQLPEFKAWSKSDPLQVVLGERVDKKVLFEGRCYWSVSVYARRGSQLDMWHVLLVGNLGREIYIDDGEGETLSLNQWRKRQAQADQSSSFKPGGK